jgi:glucan phosphoethanolaminetransferase (alkaline phosphatase superfamily)
VRPIITLGRPGYAAVHASTVILFGHDNLYPPTPRSTSWQRLALVALWVFLLSPLVLHPWLNAGKGPLDLLFLFNLVTSLLWVTLWHLLARRLFMLHLVLVPLYLTTAVDLFLVGTFNARLSSGYVTIALTNPAETSEFLSAYARPVALATLALALIYLPGLYGIRHLRRQRSPRLAALVAVLLGAVYAAAVGRGMWHGATAEQSSLDVVGKEMSAPVGAVFQAALALHLHASTSELRSQREHHSFGASKSFSVEEEVYVWVIGESSRPENWSLFGYPRDTTPRLRATLGVIALRDMLTTAPHTSVAVPSMLSLRPITDWPSVIAEKSIVGVFNEIGFKTYWLSAQEADSWGGLIPQVAAETKRRRYFDRAFDGTLLDEFRVILQGASQGDKLFIVLHTKGSHFEYARRYPPEFARFGSPGGSRRQELVDAYDNSVLYTDWFLSEVIATLSQRGGHSVLVYASDHGQNLLDDERQLFGHALGTRFDLAAAAFVWLSEGMRRSRPEHVQAAQRNAVAPLSLSNLPHSLLHLAGIDAKGFDPQMSLFNPRFAPRPRWYIVRGDLRQESTGGELE